MKTLFKDVKKYIPAAEKNNFEIQHFEMTKKEVDFAKMRASFNGSYREVYSLRPGKYIRLVRNKHTIVMSDTPMELDTNKDFVEAARGTVVIGGLGLGLVLMAIQTKKEVKKIIVYEKEQTVIDLVAKNLPLNKKVEIRLGDIFEIKPSKKFDTIYFDIWDGICSDNYEDMKKLHKTWRKTLNKDGWMHSWREEDCKYKYYQEKREERKWDMFRRNPILDKLNEGDEPNLTI